MHSSVATTNATLPGGGGGGGGAVIKTWVGVGNSQEDNIVIVSSEFLALPKLVPEAV